MIQAAPFQLGPANADVLLGFVADSIDAAARLAPAKWGVTPFHGALRLNVGLCEALTISLDEVRILVLRRAVLRLQGAPGITLRPGYRSSPGSAILEVDATIRGRLRGVLKSIREAHHAALAISSAKGLNPGAKKGHSDDAVRTIGSYLGRRVPLPTFVRPARGWGRWEGAVIEAWASKIERNKAARRECLEHYGSQCSVCGLLFEERYGPDAAGLIHVHHLRPVSALRRSYVVDPKRDLRPVCPNCHAVVHSTNPPLAIEKVRRLIRRHSSW